MGVGRASGSLKRVSESKGVVAAPVLRLVCSCWRGQVVSVSVVRVSGVRDSS